MYVVHDRFWAGVAHDIVDNDELSLWRCCNAKVSEDSKTDFIRPVVHDHAHEKDSRSL